MVLAIPLLLPFYMNFRIILSMVTKNLARKLKRIVLNLDINLGRADIFTVLSLSVRENGMSLRLCRPRFLSSGICHFQHLSPVHVLLDLRVGIFFCV